MRKHLFLILYSIFLVCATTLSLLFTYVIPVKSTVDIIGGGDYQDIPTQSGIYTETSYDDENIKINIIEKRYHNSNVYIADIKLTNLSLFKTAFAKDSYGLNIKDNTSKIAKEHKAIFAINGDYYGFRTKGYVIRNGALYDPEREYRDTKSDILVVNEDGSFTICKEASVTSSELYQNHAWQVFTFGPGLVSQKEIAVTVNQEVSTGSKGLSNPRCGVGMVEPLHYIAIVCDGRTEESQGLTLYQFAEIFQEYNCTEAYNLDGGGSATMYFHGKVVNKPTSSGTIRERSISDIVYIGY